VKLTIIAPPPKRDIEKQKELFAVQIGAFRDRGRAEVVRSEMESRYGKARIIERPAKGALYRVLVGEEEDEATATELADRIRTTGSSGFVVRVETTDRSF
jgi:cell division protein FtsN